MGDMNILRLPILVGFTGLCLSCTSAKTPGASPADGSGGAGSWSEGGSDDGTGDDGTGDDGSGGDTAGGEAGPCPVGMVGIPNEDPEYCIDRYEASLTEAGDMVQSVAGVIPLSEISFDAARALCEATPVMVDGEIVGQRRLASIKEWRDAADGVPGEGGSQFPTGDTWPEGQCATPDAAGNPTTDGLVPTGSMPECTGIYGLYDQLGNAWEWVDPRLLVSIEEFLQRRSEDGLVLTIDEAGALFVESGDASVLDFEVHGVFGTVTVDADNRLQMAGPVLTSTDSDHQGYLVKLADVSRRETGFLLPIAVDVDGGDAEAAPVVVRLDADGSPVTAKVGCAWYAGTEETCGTKNWFFAHPNDFVGTIGLRCVCDPLP